MSLLQIVHEVVETVLEKEENNRQFPDISMGSQKKKISHKTTTQETGWQDKLCARFLAKLEIGQ